MILALPYEYFAGKDLENDRANIKYEGKKSY